MRLQVYPLLQNAVQIQPKTYGEMALNMRGRKPAKHSIYAVRQQVETPDNVFKPFSKGR